jgi:hypothetical protein
MSYLIPILFSFLSSLRVQFLPEFQLVLIILFYFRKGLSPSFFFILICVFTTHHYAIPDHDFRFESDNYPSIYTKTTFGLKLLDIFTIFFFIICLPRIYSIKGFILNQKTPVFLLFFVLLGMINIDGDKFDFDMFLFLSRNYLLIVLFYLAARDFDKNDFNHLAVAAIIGWGSKMFFSILLPHSNPLTREILGFEGIIYFAGDEYSTLGLYVAMILMTNNYFKFNKYISWLIFGIFILTIISQRKGAIPYFLFIFFLFKVGNKKGSNRLFNYLLFLFDWIVLFFVLFLDSLNNPLLSLAFYEYTSLAYSAIDSIHFLRLNEFYHYLFGLGPFGKYEIKNLSDFADHPMSFGNEVGNKYRYAIWNLPYGRALLNIGLLGTVALLISFFNKARKYNSLYFYLYFNIALIFTFLVVTPIGSLALGLSLSFLININSDIYLIDKK